MNQSWNITQQGLKRVKTLKNKNLSLNNFGVQLSLVMRCIRNFEHPPTLIEISNETGIESSIVHVLIGELFRQGYVSWTKEHMTVPKINRYSSYGRKYELRELRKQASKITKRYRLTNPENLQLFAT